MIRKLLLVFICLIVLISCGRKADPKYETSQLKIVTKKV